MLWKRQNFLIYWIFDDIVMITEHFDSILNAFHVKSFYEELLILKDFETDTWKGLHHQLSINAFSIFMLKIFFDKGGQRLLVSQSVKNIYSVNLIWFVFYVRIVLHCEQIVLYLHQDLFFYFFHLAFVSENLQLLDCSVD